MAVSADTTIIVLRTVSWKALWYNVEHENAEQCYRRTLFITLLDCLVQQRNDRFQGRTKGAIKGMYLILSSLKDVDDKVEHVKRCRNNLERKNRKTENTLSNIGTFNSKKHSSNLS